MPGRIESDVIESKAYLKSNFININQDWLTGCVEFFHEQNGNKVINKEDLIAMVKNQWMLGDLREISSGCLPPNLCDQIKTSLNGTYVLQMNFICDIGVPAYQQLQKLKKVDTTNIEATNNITSAEPSSQRMLKLFLTDGEQEITAIEYRPMRNLSNDLTPGIKLQLKGPVDCRRGVLMLEERHINIIGGEVDDLLEINHSKNILSRRINATEQNFQSFSTFTRATYKPTVSIITNNIIPNARDVISTVRSQPITNAASVNMDEALDIEMIMDDSEIEQLNQIESQAISANTRQKPNEYTSLENAPKRIKMDLTSLPNSSESIHLNLIHPSSLSEEGFTENDDFDEYYNEPSVITPIGDRNVFANENFEKLTNRIDSGKPYNYLKQLSDISEIEKLDKTYIVKAQIIRFLGKITFVKEWLLRCSLIDGSGKLDVNISNDVLTEMIGYSPAEIITMKKQKGMNPEIKLQITKGLENAQQQLLNLDCLLYVTFKSEGPCVSKIEKFGVDKIKQLKDRFSHLL